MHLKDICQVSPEKYWTWRQKGFELLKHTATFSQCSHPQPSPLDTLGDGEAWTRKSSVFLRISHLPVVAINFIKKGTPCQNQHRGTCTGMWRWRTTVICSLWVTLSAFTYLIKIIQNSFPRVHSPPHPDTYTLIQHLLKPGWNDLVHLFTSSLSCQKIVDFRRTVVYLSCGSISNTQTSAGHSLHGGLKWINKCIKYFPKTILLCKLRWSLTLQSYTEQILSV